MNQFTFREARTDDTEQILRIYLKDEARNQCVDSELEIKEYFASPEKKIIVAQNNESLIGFSLFQIEFECAYLNHVAVAKNERRNGIGTKLVDEMINYILRNRISVRQVHLEPVNEIFWERYSDRSRFDVELEIKYDPSPYADPLKKWQRHGIIHLDRPHAKQYSNNSKK